MRTAPSETEKQDPHIRKLLAKITSYNNVPRKETKFKVCDLMVFRIILRKSKVYHAKLGGLNVIEWH